MKEAAPPLANKALAAIPAWVAMVASGGIIGSRPKLFNIHKKASFSAQPPIIAASEGTSTFRILAVSAIL